MTVTTIIEPMLVEALTSLKWSGRFDDEHQPLDKDGKRIARRCIRLDGSYHTDGLRIYPPRLLGNIPRTARWAAYARQREARYWDEHVYPLAREIHEKGGVAFAADREDDTFDVWRVETESRFLHGLSMRREHMVPREKDANGEPYAPLELEAHKRMLQDLRQTHRDLGALLTKNYNRVSHGDIRERTSAVCRALEWAMKEIIRRKVGEVAPEKGPRVTRIHIAGVGEWIWRRSDDGWGWTIVCAPHFHTVEIQVT